MSASIAYYVSRRLTRNDTTSSIWGPCPPHLDEMEQEKDTFVSEVVGARRHP
jgi:hypothetical protein